MQNAPDNSVPVLLIIFNRPAITTKVLQALRQVRPKCLLVAADGPRPSKVGELELCAQTRSLVDSLVDWPCTIIRRYSEVNLGCGVGVASAIAWALELSEEVIILEDDCVPHPDFFPFAAKMLDRYRDDSRVMLISGINVLRGRRTLPFSYAFSRYPLTWGWATWRRAWKSYDYNLSKWPEIRDAGLLKDILRDRREEAYWTQIFDTLQHSGIDTWDYQVHLQMWLNATYAIYPEVNLITNIGIEGTHFSRELPIHNIPTDVLTFPLRHPPVIYRDVESDKLIRSTWYLPTLPDRFRRKLLRLVPAWGPRRVETAI